MINSAPSASVLEILSSHQFAEVIHNVNTKESALFSLTGFKKFETICKFSANETLRKPTYLTVQTGVDKHITLAPSFLQYINHSCNPNVFFDTTRMELIALRDIASQEELTFFYPSTEWEMTQPFNCYCGNRGCLKTIKGAKFLSKKNINEYQLTDFIKRQLARL